MNADAVFSLLNEVKRLCGHQEFVVIGSLSILGLSEVSTIPADMSMSIDVDSYALSHPRRLYESDVSKALGEGSPWHAAHQTFLDPVRPALATLPEGWEQRLIKLERTGIAVHFLEPNDAAISKLTRGEPRDLRWVRAGLSEGLMSLPMIKLRSRSTRFLDDTEQSETLARIESLG
jgi:hypothetical protein